MRVCDGGLNESNDSVVLQALLAFSGLGNSETRSLNRRTGYCTVYYSTVALSTLHTHSRFIHEHDTRSFLF